MSTVETPSDLALHIDKAIDIDAPIETTFEALLEELGEGNQSLGADSMRFKLEAYPGGRWFRDLGDNNGHLWGHVQVIKRPTLLEITGPLFMSYAVVSHVQWRLADLGDGKTRLTLTHQALGAIDKQHREGVHEGWGHQLDAIRTRAEST